MKLTRFELSFDGELQDVGMFQGLPDVGLRCDKYDRLLGLFEDLKSPFLDFKVFDHQDFEAVSFWFTPLGLKRFQKEINQVQQTIRLKGWDLVRAEIDDQYVDPIYKDEYQMAVPVEQAKNLMPKYSSF